MDVTGDVTGEKYAGIFGLKVHLSWQDVLRQDEIRRGLLAGVNPETAHPDVVAVANAASYLGVRVIRGDAARKLPDWYVNSNGALALDDTNVLVEVHNAALAEVTKALEEVAAKAEKARAGLPPPPEG